jgi:hypothetical protein
VKEFIDMLLDITANRPSEESEIVSSLRAECEKILSPALEELRLGASLADVLALPANVPVQFQIRVLPRMNGSLDGHHIPLKASVLSLPPLLAKMRPLLEDELGDQLFRTLRQVHVPAEVASALGFSAQEPARFELELDEETPEVYSVPVSQDCAPGSRYSWSKGCSSWPS